MVGAWLYLTEGNVLFAGLAYYMYKRLGQPQTPQGDGAAAGAQQATTS